MPHINPQIVALHELQVQDRRLTRLERRLDGIPGRVAELQADLAKLEEMLNTERRKLEDTVGFQRQQEGQLSDEEELMRQSKAKMNQVKTARELNATQRELESTRRMAAKRSEEIKKIEEGVKETEARIATMERGLNDLRAKADEETSRLETSQGTLEKKIAKLQAARQGLTSQIDREILSGYERIRRKLGGIAFVAASQERCTACKMQVPHILFSRLMKGVEIVDCEHCGRLMYWQGHFPEEAEKRKAAEEEARKKKAPAASV